MARPDKAATIAELTRQFRGSNAAVLTEYRGLTVSQLTQLRTSLKHHATYAVVKNTLTKLAARDAGVTAFEGQLAGPSAVAFVTGDPVEAAKSLRDFSRAHPALVIKVGVLDGNALTADEVRRLADLESREVLLARTAGAMKASLTRAAYLFNAPLAKAARTVDALRLKLEEGAPPAPEPEPAAESHAEPATADA
jgi:large subunit ribosomal protein L10